MFKIGIRLLAARGLRQVRANQRAPFHIPRPLLDKELWQRSPSRIFRLSSTLSTLSIVALASSDGAHFRAESSEEDTLVPEQQPATEENDSTVGKTSKADTKPTIVGMMQNMWYNIMDSRSRALVYGLLGANVAIYSAFTLGFFLNRPPKPSPALLRFLSRNFVLSLGWLSRGRWHVMLTCMFAHLTRPHLVNNMWGMFVGVWVCSGLLDVWQIAGLYFGGGLVGGSTSMCLTKILQKPRYITGVTGSSDGIYALWYYWLCAEDWEHLKLLSFPLEPFVAAMFVYMFMAECVGLRKYIRYGYTGRGPNAVTGNPAAHLGGAVTGLLAYGAPRILETIRRDDSSNNENEGIEQDGKAENLREPTFATGRVRE